MRPAHPCTSRTDKARKAAASVGEEGPRAPTGDGENGAETWVTSHDSRLTWHTPGTAIKKKILFPVPHGTIPLPHKLRDAGSS